jgi:hypothetical protein
MEGTGAMIAQIRAGGHGIASGKKGIACHAIRGAPDKEIHADAQGNARQIAAVIRDLRGSRR